jgi:hypothetical protein
MKRLLATAMLVAATALVGTAFVHTGAAYAADGTGLQPGGTACTDRSRSDAGAWAYGRATNPAPVTWTVLASASPGGPETELARRTGLVGAGGRACGEWFAGWETPTARLVGTAGAPVRFSVRVTNGDGEDLGEFTVGTGTSIDRILTPPADQAYEICVTNPTAGPTAATWEAA